MIEVIFARRLLAISRHRDFPTELDSSRLDIQPRRGKRCACVEKLSYHFVIFDFRLLRTRRQFFSEITLCFFFTDK